MAKTTHPSDMQKRTRIRFAPDPSTLAYVDFVPESPAFKGEHVGLVCNESFSGCGIIVLKGEVFNVGQKVKVKVGILDPVPAKVQWITEVDNQVSRIGFEYNLPKTAGAPKRAPSRVRAFRPKSRKRGSDPIKKE